MADQPRAQPWRVGVTAAHAPGGAGRYLKIGISAIIVLDLIALSSVALHRSSTTTTVKERRTADVAAAAPSTPAAPSSTPSPAVTPPGASVVPISITLPAAPPTTAASAPTTPTIPTSPTGPSTSPTTPPPSAEAGAAACPIPLAKPATNGGLQSLISLSPGFGPFSAEAFAMASAYQPVLQLLGPILAQYPTLAKAAGPQITAFLTPWENVLNAVFTVINPYYAPYREQVLTAETKLASFLSPYADKLANSALGGCLVDVEAALVGDVAKNQTSTTAQTSAIENKAVMP